MHVALEKSLRNRITVGIECESIEHDHYGVARLIRSLLKQLALRPELARTHRFVLYFNGQPPSDAVLDNPLFTKRHAGLSRWSLPSSFSIYYFLLLPFRLWFDRPDIMYWPNYMLPIINPPFVPSLVMLTEDVWYEMRNSRRAWRYKLAYWIFGNWAARFATRIMAISHASAENLHKLFGISTSRIVINQLAVDTPTPTYGITRTQPYILWVGQAFERRHLRETLMAFERIAPRFGELQFVVVGPDKYETPTIAPLAMRINQTLGRDAVILFEYASDQELAVLYKNAKILTYISNREGFGLPPLEALSYGAIPVVADLPVHHEVFGDFAFYVDSFGAEGIAKTLTRALTDTETQQRIREARPEIVARYSWQNHTDRFLEIIKSIT